MEFKKSEYDRYSDGSGNGEIEEGAITPAKNDYDTLDAGREGAETEEELDKSLEPHEDITPDNAVEFGGGDDYADEEDSSDGNSETLANEVTPGQGEQSYESDRAPATEKTAEATPESDSAKSLLITGSEISTDEDPNPSGGIITHSSSLELPSIEDLEAQGSPDGEDENPYSLYGFFIMQDGQQKSVEVPVPSISMAKAMINGDKFLQIGKDGWSEHKIIGGTPGICRGEQELFVYRGNEWVKS